MPQSKPRVFKYVFVFMCIFVGLTTLVQPIAYMTGVFLGQGIVFSNFIASACAAAMVFVHDFGRVPDGWENRLLSLACIVIFSFFELAIGYVLLNSEGGEVLEAELRDADPVSLSALLCGVVFSLYLCLLIIFGWGTKLYIKFVGSAG